MCFFSFPLPTKQGEPTKNTCDTVTVGPTKKKKKTSDMKRTNTSSTWKIWIEESWFVILGIPMDDFKIPTSKRKGEFLSPSSLFAFSTHLTWFWKHQIHWISTLFPQKATEPASVPRRRRAGKPHRWNIFPNQKRKKPEVSDMFREFIKLFIGTTPNHPGFQSPPRIPINHF